LRKGTSLRIKSALILVALAAIPLGCGGGGGGGGSEPDPVITDIHIEGVDGSSHTVDLANVQVGDSIQLRLWGRNSSGAVVPVTATSWSTTAPASVATVSSSGLLVVTGVGTGTYQVSANGGAYTHTLKISTTSAIVQGKVRNTDSVGVPGVKVTLFDAGGTAVGNALTGSDGTFRILGPATAKSFSVDTSPRAGAYANYFSYRTSSSTSYKDYSDDLCPGPRPTLPSVAIGSTTTLPYDIVVYKSGGGGTPPPPPPDCLAD